MTHTKSTLAGICLLVAASFVSAQSSAQTASGNATAQPVVKSAADWAGQLPAELLAQLALNKEQQEKLDAAQIARRQLWSANRRERQNEYELVAKELEKDNFDPRAIINARKKIRQAADARMDDVQKSWLAFWDSLNEAQRKSLVAYMKSQHRILGKAPTPAPATK